jgi:glycosyltransferase involved in cell wall biosynthesis
MTTLYVVVPCYNEQEVLSETTKRLTDKLRRMMAQNLITAESRVMYVDDGSSDATWEMIRGFHDENQLVTGVKLSRNRGHQNALLAGLMTAKELADCVISLDADLQDDIEVLDQFVQKFEEDCDIVLGVRKSRGTDTVFKRNTANLFYKLMRWMGVDIVYNHADYRLMSKRAIAALEEFGEVNLFLRGIVPQIGYKTATVEYDRSERFAGESKYPLRKMLAFAFDGVTSFSVKPIRMIATAGVFVSVISLVILIYFLIRYAAGDAEPWQAVTILSVWLLGGLQLAAIGVVGAYVGKAYLETKRRPRYIIESILK